MAYSVSRSSPPPLAALQRSPPSARVALPPSVEEMIGRICRDKGVSPPEPQATILLSDLGETAALDILAKIASSSKKVQTFTGYIIYLAKAAAGGAGIPVRANSAQEGAASHNSANSSSPSRKKDEYHSSPASLEMHLRQTVSPEVAALGELDFRKAFLVLSYIGNSRLEERVSADVIRGLKTLPMSSFEAEIWRSFGHHCISEAERRHNHDWDSEKPNLYHCHVDLEGRVTFKGPYLQQRRTHLQNVLGDENVLVVKFAEKEGKGKGYQRNIQYYSSLYKRFSSEGIAVGLRFYRFFVFKDGGKEERKKNPTSSPVKCYFVCTESQCSSDRQKPYILLGKPMHEARSVFMHVHMVSTISKYMPRFSLILSKTIKLDVDFASVNIIHIDDVPCKDESGNPVYDEAGEPMIHTDGTGYISEDLALKCPRNLSKGHYLIPTDIQRIINAFKLEDQCFPLKQWHSLVSAPPLLMQVRLFYNGYAIKGTLLVNKKLPPQTIHVRRHSMVKVDVDPHISIQSVNSLEVVATSNLPKKTTTLSRNIIALLHHGGVPRKFFLDLLSNALLEAERFCLDRRAALKVALRYADMDDYLVLRMILCGIPMEEPFLKSRLSVLMREEKKSLKEGKLPLSDCYYLMGTADPTGTLKSNEVCIILDKGQVSGNVLVYRNPGLHFGDIHAVTATYVKDLESIVGNAKYAIFFPSQGQRSLAYEIANSDFDGDMYWVSMNDQLLHYFRPSLPWTGTSVNRTKCNQESPTDYSAPELESKLFDLFLETRFTPSYSMSTSADSWLAFMDRLLTLGDDCEEEKCILRQKMLKLVDIYYDALDAPKKGLKVDVPDDLKAEKYPHFLEKKKKCFYTSTSILGEIFDKVNTSQTVSNEEIWKLSCFEGKVTLSKEIWQSRYEQYRREMSQAISVESKEMKNAAAKDVIQKYKMMLYGAAELEDSTREREDVLDEALSIYHASYDYAIKVNEMGRCSFAWNVAGQALCELYSKIRGNSSISCSLDVLREVLG